MTIFRFVPVQGRSRTLIIRELQRTNLDVNLAVNNLLSRDEEDGDDAEDGGQDAAGTGGSGASGASGGASGGAGASSYAPEDLISLLDAGISADHPSVIIDADAMFSDEAMFGYSQARSRCDDLCVQYFLIDHVHVGVSRGHQG